MDDEIFVEKFCRMCGKPSWDSQTGYYNETHVNPLNGNNYPCDTDGTRSETTNDGFTTYYLYPSGKISKYSPEGFLIEGEE